MQFKTDKELILFCSILELGKGSKMLKLAKELGAVSSVAFLGKGTVRDDLLNLLGILESKKEIILSIINKDLEETFFSRVTEKFQMEKPQHGIAFSMPLKYYLIVNNSERVDSKEREGVKKMGYESIFIVANKDSLDDILDAAEAGGATGGTIIHGRGAGNQEKALLFNLEIEPEKVIVLILSKKNKTDTIINSIRKELKIHEPNGGIVFVMDVSRAFGLYGEKI